MRRELISIFILLFSAHVIHAQCPAPDFTVPATACRDQNLTVTNTSPAGTFQWDYCTGDLTGTPTAAPAFTLVGANGRPSLEYVKDGNTWYAFATGTFSNKLFRLTFSDGLQQPPFVEDLGSLGGKLSGPGTIRIIRSNNSWFGLLHNTDNGELLKLTFGSSLTNAITVSSLFTGIGSINAGLAVGHDATDGWVCVLSTSANEYKIIRLGENITAPTPTDILTSATVPNPNNLFDVDLVKQCDQWYAFSTNLGNGNIYRLSFGSSLFQQPVIDQISDLGGVNSGRVRVMQDGERYYLAVVTLAGTFFKVALGTDLATPTNVIQNEGNFSGTLQAPIGVGAVVDQSVWVIGSVDASTGQVVSIKYPNTCSVQEVSSDATTSKIRYTQQGTYQLSLTMTNGAGINKTITKAITISSNASPDIAISSQNICAGHVVNFSSQNTSGGITSYDWDFDDGSAHSPAALPPHTFAAAGTYDVLLTVGAANGCTNTAVKSIKQYAEPVASFTLPVALICTNNAYSFSNTTTDVYDGNLQYQWNVDNVASGTSRDLSHTFTTTGSKDIELIVSIPGCSDNEVKQVANVNTGPTVGFTVAGSCAAEEFAFTNSSSGDIASYAWDFGDGNTSTAVNSTNTFATSGSYPVTLNTFGTNGCLSTKVENVVVYSLPEPAFALDLPPFSCSGTPSQFHDNTPAVNDSNIQSWSWVFGDTGTGAGKNPVHTYGTAGDYTVRLSVLTDKGCSSFKDQQVTIAQSPIPAFSTNPACVTQATQFTDMTTGDIKTYQWLIGNSTYSLQNPAHVFLTSGTYGVQLSVTAQNNCAAVLNKQIVVPVVPVIDIDLKNACSGQPAVFTDITTETSDPIVIRKWTFNNTATANGKEATFNFTNAGSYPVQLQVQNQSGCVYSLTRQFTIHPSPVASFTMSPESGPAPLSVAFTNTSTGSTSWQWNFNDGTAVSTDKSPTHVFQNLGQYAVDLKAIGTGGCSKTISQPVSVIIPFNELALTEFSVVQNEVNAPYKGFVRVSNAGNYRINNFTVFYEVGGGVRIKEVVTASLNPGQSGLFLLSNEFVGVGGYVCAELADDTNVSNNKACSSMGGESVILEAYPNPADSYLNIETIQASADQVHVRIYNSSGGEAYNRTFDASNGLSRLSLDVQNLSPGIYVVVVSSGTGASTRRILISR